MKSVDRAIVDRTGAFWLWFNTVSNRLADNPEDPELLEALDHQVGLLHPDLSWELGPGQTADWHLAISPNLNPDLADVARQIVAQAPRLSRWEFFSARQPKTWSGSFEIETEQRGTIRLDASHWGYVLLRYPDGAHEIVLRGDNISALDASERWTAAAIVLEGLLGEEVMMHRNVAFELTDALDPRFATKEKPISELRGAMGIRG